MKKIYPPLWAILAALLFGASTPLSKMLLGEMDSIVLASLLYLGSGLGLIFLLLLQKFLAPAAAATEASIERKDVPWLAGAILTGGVAAPIILLFGLKYSSAAAASLLLNFEGAATTLIAAWVFKESVGRRTGIAITLITLASILLTWKPGEVWQFSLGALGIVGACTLWGLDNNLTRNISSKNPLAIVAIKGLVSGAFSMILALSLGKPIPAVDRILFAMLLGFLCYGVSITLFILALRNLGAARTSTLFGIAPFVGMFLSIVIFKETLQGLFVASVLIMLAGAWLMLGEKHDHIHIHDQIDHEHAHAHPDEHHAHETTHASHYSGEHSHPHIHEGLEHDHGHNPDIHHRHQHDSK